MDTLNCRTCLDRGDWLNSSELAICNHITAPDVNIHSAHSHFCSCWIIRQKRGHRSESWPGLITKGIVKQSPWNTQAPSACCVYSSFQQGCWPTDHQPSASERKELDNGDVKGSPRAQGCEKMALWEWEACLSICLSGGGPFCTKEAFVAVRDLGEGGRWGRWGRERKKREKRVNWPANILRRNIHTNHRQQWLNNVCVEADNVIDQYRWASVSWWPAVNIEIPPLCFLKWILLPLLQSPQL